MSGQTPVVVGTDGSKHANTAVRWAAQHAARHEAPLMIATAASAPVAYGMGGHLPQDFFDALKEEGGRIVEDAAVIARAEAPNVDVETGVAVDATGPALLHLSETAQVLVVGTRGLSGIASAFMGSVSSLIARHSACPVVVARSVSEDGAPPASGPVVVGIDGSENSEPALAAAMKEASLRDATLIAVHAWSDVPLSTMDPVTQVGELFKTLWFPGLAFEIHLLMFIFSHHIYNQMICGGKEIRFTFFKIHLVMLVPQPHIRLLHNILCSILVGNAPDDKSKNAIRKLIHRMIVLFYRHSTTAFCCNIHPKTNGLTKSYNLYNFGRKRI